MRRFFVTLALIAVVLAPFGVSASGSDRQIAEQIVRGLKHRQDSGDLHGFNIDLQVKENFGQMMEYPGTGMRNGVDPVLVADPLFGFWRSYNRSEKEVWQNEEFWALGDRLESSLDVQERLEVYTRMMDIFDFEDPPAFILHMMGTFWGKRKNISWKPSESVYVQFADATTG